jgi:phosphohistidine phosphatase
MDLYLIRHADALALGERGITEDAERPLSEEGQAQAQSVGAGLQRMAVQLSLIVTSPLVRARQTTEGIVRGWAAPAPEVQVNPLLAPGGKRGKLAKALRALGWERLAVVGHQPDLGQFAAWLIGSKKAQVELAKAGVAYVHCPDGPAKGGGSLVWLVTPEWLA